MSSKLVYFKIVFDKVDLKYPITPEAEIHVRYDGTYNRMTPKISETELNGYIDRLIDELEQIRREGKLKFTAANKKLRM